MIKITQDGRSHGGQNLTLGNNSANMGQIHQ